MLVEFREADRMFGLKAIGIYRKGIEAASAACEKVYCPTLELQEADTAANFVEGWIAENLDEMGAGETRELNVPISSALALRTACSVYLTQLGKLSEKQADLLVPVEDTNVLMSHLTSLADRLRGQMEMAGVNATISVNGSPAIPMEEFERRVENLVRGK